MTLRTKTASMNWALGEDAGLKDGRHGVVAARGHRRRVVAGKRQAAETGSADRRNLCGRLDGTAPARVVEGRLATATRGSEDEGGTGGADDGASVVLGVSRGKLGEESDA